MDGLLPQGAPPDDESLRRKPTLPSSDGDALVIGLVNNMPDAELERTEQQFRDLLAAASSGTPLSLKLIALSGVPRSEAGLAQIAHRYVEFGALAGGSIDGLIVTGTEPRAASLTAEPFWPAFEKLVDWAAEHTVSTIWSCLAAHAAVLYLDGIARHPFADKLSGVFLCETCADHALVQGQGPPRFIPHSRHNGLSEEMLSARGYHILARSAEAGPDLFVRESGSSFVFLQGHPEYDRHALHREYRRDMGRFLGGRSNRCPEIPRNYFKAEIEDALVAFRLRALRQRSRELLAEFPGIEDTAIIQTWSNTAVSFYRSWLDYLSANRARSGLRAFHARGASRRQLVETARVV